MRHLLGKKGGFVISAVLLGVILITIALAFYLRSQFTQLDRAFNNQDQFVPTRIYSDVTRIAAPQPRKIVETRLQALGYEVHAAGNDLSFRLRPLDYPSYLIPDNHPILAGGAQPSDSAPPLNITLLFDGADKNSLLHSIQLNGQEISDAYLEPELIATLTRSGVSGPARNIRSNLKFNEIPANVWKAVIAVEDQHFLEHNGLDPRGLARMVWVNLRSRSLVQGGSTITAQLVKNLMARRGRNVVRKINELFLTLMLEAKYDKEQILERYLNEVNLGQFGNLEVHGVAEGAEFFFGKRIEDLTLGEIAFMMGLVRGTDYYSPYKHFDRAQEREHLVLKKMVETGQIAQDEANAAMRSPVRIAPRPAAGSKAPYFTDFVKADLIRRLKDRMNEAEIVESGLRVYTTLDPTLNSIAQRAVQSGVTDLEKRIKLPTGARFEGAMAAVDQSTGYVRALIGGRSYAQSTFNRILNMKRQIGSTFKPVVYLTAYEKGEDPDGIPYGPGHPAQDAPWTLFYDGDRQSWAPKNYEPDYMGWINYRIALAHSVNTIAAKLGVELGLENVAKMGRRLGIESELPAVPSLSLGVAELSPVELLKVYATIANHGIQTDLAVLRGITKGDGTNYLRLVYTPSEAVARGPADLLTDTLQNVFTEGTASAAHRLGFDRPAAGKTGTTSHHRDAWFAGYTPQLTAVVWVGQDQDQKSGAPGKLTGANSALPIWISFMKEALEHEPATVFPQTDQITAVKINRHTGKAASWSCSDNQSSVEKYVTGHEPKATSCESDWPKTVSETHIK